MRDPREMKVDELRSLASELGIDGRSDMNKEQLVESILRARGIVAYSGHETQQQELQQGGSVRVDRPGIPDARVRIRNATYTDGVTGLSYTDGEELTLGGPLAQVLAARGILEIIGIDEE